MCSVDLSENYANGISVHADGHDSSMRRWPMDTALIVNCLWVESTYYTAGIYSPRQLNSETWAGAITASLYHNLYFAIYEGTDEELVSAALSTSRELHKLSPALFSSAVDLSRPEIDVTVQAIPVPGLPVHWRGGHQVPGSPPTGAGGVVARAWSQAVGAGAL